MSPGSTSAQSVLSKKGRGRCALTMISPLASPNPIAHALAAAAKTRRRRTAPAAAEGETTRTAPAAAEGETTRISSLPGTRPPFHGRRQEAVTTRRRGRGEVQAGGSTRLPCPSPDGPQPQPRHPRSQLDCPIPGDRLLEPPWPQRLVPEGT